MLEDRAPEELVLHVSDPEEQEPDEELVLTPSTEEKPDEELILTPSPEEEQTESEELTLEAESINKASEVTFEDEDESEERVKRAMEEYDAAMDAAAGKSN